MKIARIGSSKSHVDKGAGYSGLDGGPSLSSIRTLIMAILYICIAIVKPLLGAVVYPARSTIPFDFSLAGGDASSIQNAYGPLE